jgi:hypothetical protein
MMKHWNDVGCGVRQQMGQATAVAPIQTSPREVV